MISDATVTRPVTVRYQSRTASTPSRNCEYVTSLSLSDRSTSTPACSEKMRIGSAPEATTIPTTKALSDNSSANQPSAMDCIHEPTSDIVCPIQNARKFRCVMSTRNGLKRVSATIGEVILLRRRQETGGSKQGRNETFKH